MSIFDFKAKTNKGEEISLEQYKGNVVLVLNSATACGFTPQYDALQDLYEKYANEGFTILDFPCNQFGGQAPGSDEEIHVFCDTKFGIKFPMFSKIDVNGENAHPLYKYLVGEKKFEGFTGDAKMSALLDNMLSEKDADYKNDPSIKWNFTKFLVDRDGVVVRRFEPTEDMADVEAAVKELL